MLLTLIALAQKLTDITDVIRDLGGLENYRKPTAYLQHLYSSG